MAGQDRALTLQSIGSVLPLPQVEGPPRPDSVWAAWTADRTWSAFRSARSAVAALLSQRGIGRVWLPAYICLTLADAVASVCEVCWYGVDEALEPDTAFLADAVRPGDAVIGVDYFGRRPCAHLAELARSRPDVLWIEDRAQALAAGPTWGEMVVYSPRKLVGVGEGGVLVGPDAPAPDAPSRTGPPGAQLHAAQAARAQDPGGVSPQTWGPLFQAQEAAFQVDRTPMAEETRRVLERLALEPLKASRLANARLLSEALADLSLWPSVANDAPLLAFPVRLKNRDRVAQELARRRIFCARHWSATPSPAETFPIAHRLANEMLSLPCDHIYDVDDMVRIVEALRHAQAEGVR